MSNLILPRSQVWTSQPGQISGVDRSNPLSRGLVAAFDFSVGVADAVTGRIAENKGCVFDVSSTGRGIRPVTAGIRLPWDMGFTGEDISITVVEYRKTPPSSYWMVCDNRESGNGYTYGSSSSIYNPAGTLTTPGYKVTTYCKSEFYQNKIKTSSAIGTSLIPKAGIRFFGRYTDADAYTNGVVCALIIHSRNIGADEHAALVDNPWQIFQRHDSSIFAPTSGSEGQTLIPSLFTNAQVHYVPAVNSSNILLPNQYSNSQVFYLQDVLPSNSLVANIYTNSDSFFTPVLTATNTLVPVILSNTSLFLDASVSTSNSILSSLYSNSQAFYAATLDIEGGPQQLTADRLDNNQVFYSQVLSVGEVQVITSLYENNHAFYNPVLTSSITLTSILFTNNNEIYEALVNLGEAPQVITPLLFSNDQLYFTQLVTTGQVVLSPVILSSNSAFYHAVLSNGVITRFILRLPSSITTELQEVSHITTSINLTSEIESGES